MSHEPPITIKYEQSLTYASSEHWQEGRTVFIQIFDSIVSSGLLARLTGNAFKVLSALGLAASPLGVGSEKDEAFFQDLVAADIVALLDRGKLFCCIPHEELVRRTGISKNTLSRCTDELEAHGMVEKRAVRKADGTRYNIFFILSASSGCFPTAPPSPLRHSLIGSPLPRMMKAPPTSRTETLSLHFLPPPMRSRTSHLS
jgi:hypothetical protein